MIYEQIADFIKFIHITDKNGMILTGGSGINKTEITRESLKNNKYNYAYDKAVMNKASDLYKTLFRNNGKTVVLDESDKLLSQKKYKEILLSALEFGHERRIKILSRNDTKIIKTSEWEQLDEKKKEIYYPSWFYYTGKIIFISNIPDNEVIDAYFSRTMHINVNLDRAQILNEILSEIDHHKTEVETDVKLEVFNYIADRINNFSRFCFREYSKIIDMRVHMPTRWKIYTDEMLRESQRKSVSVKSHGDDKNQLKLFEE